MRHYIDQFKSGDFRNVAVGTHGLTILNTLMEIFEVSPDKFRSMKDFLSHAPNLGITFVAFDTENSEQELLVYADASYLSGKAIGYTTDDEEKQATEQQFSALSKKRRLEQVASNEPHMLSDYYPVDPPSVSDYEFLKACQEKFIERRREEQLHWLNQVSKKAPIENLLLIREVLIPYVDSMRYDTEPEVRHAAGNALEVLRAEEKGRVTESTNEFPMLGVVGQILDGFFSPALDHYELLHFTTWLASKTDELENQDHPFLGWGNIDLNVSPAIKSLSNSELRALLHGAGVESVTDEALVAIRKAKVGENILHPLYIPTLITDYFS